ncbi:MAG TPA: phage portal protein [Abditibacteriaceae bacterium]|jgi:HK97 family phage portal protein
MVLPFLNQIGKLLDRPVLEGSNGRGGAFRWLRGAEVDFEAEAPHVWKSSVPALCLAWEKRASIEAEICIQTTDTNEDWKRTLTPRARKALQTLRHPHPGRSGRELLDALRFDFHVFGDAYIWKGRAGSGRVVQLWHMPATMIDPRWKENGSDFISCYEYRVNGEVYAIPVEDIIHIRNGYNPDWQGRKGVGTWHASLREVATDNEAGAIAAYLCKNIGIPGVIVSPKQLGSQGITKMEKAQRAEFKEMWRESFTGANRGEPFIQSIPVDITMPGFSLEQMCFGLLRSVPEERLSGAFGIPGAIINLGSAVGDSKTKGGRNDERKQAYENCVIPNNIIFAQALTDGFLAEEFDTLDYRVWFDLSNVACLKADENELFKTLVQASGGPFLTPNEARTKTGYKPIEGGDTLREPKAPEAPDLEGDLEGKEDDPSSESTAEQNKEIKGEVEND